MELSNFRVYFRFPFNENFPDRNEYLYNELRRNLVEFLDGRVTEVPEDYVWEGLHRYLETGRIDLSSLGFKERVTYELTDVLNKGNVLAINRRFEIEKRSIESGGSEYILLFSNGKTSRLKDIFEDLLFGSSDLDCQLAIFLHRFVNAKDLSSADKISIIDYMFDKTSEVSVLTKWMTQKSTENKSLYEEMKEIDGIFPQHEKSIEAEEKFLSKKKKFLSKVKVEIESLKSKRNKVTEADDKKLRMKIAALFYALEVSNPKGSNFFGEGKFDGGVQKDIDAFTLLFSRELLPDTIYNYYNKLKGTTEKNQSELLEKVSKQNLLDWLDEVGTQLKRAEIEINQLKTKFNIKEKKSKL